MYVLDKQAEKLYHSLLDFLIFFFFQYEQVLKVSIGWVSAKQHSSVFITCSELLMCPK